MSERRACASKAPGRMSDSSMSFSWYSSKGRPAMCARPVPPPLSALESEIEAVARELAASGEGKQVGAFHLGWWSEQMLQWAFTHPEFKTQLFRFVDVFPSCRDAGDVLRHMAEYFDGVPVPRAVELG